MKKKAYLSVLVLLLFVFASCSPDIVEEKPIFTEEISLPEKDISKEIPLEENKLTDVSRILTTPAFVADYSYTIPNFVDASEFDFGDYLPVFTYATDADSSPIKTSFGVWNGGRNILDSANNYFLYENTGADIEDIYCFSKSESIRKSTDLKSNKENNALDNFYFHDSFGDIEELYEGKYYINGEDYRKIVIVKNGIEFVNNQIHYTYFHINQIIDGRYFVATAISDYYTYKGGYFRTYLYDFETQEYIPLADKACYPILSPDRKYLAYTSNNIEVRENNKTVYSKSKGFYLLNLETKETVYMNYPYYEGEEFKFINWIKKEDYLQKVEDLKGKAEFGEYAEKFFDTYVYLKEKDNDTVNVSINIPDDFSERPFDPEELITPEQFTWGEYVPFVSYVIGTYTASDQATDYAIISSKTQNMADAIQLYNSLNDKFLIKRPICNHDVFGFDPMNSKFIRNVFYDSKIIDISENVDQVVRESYEVKDESKYQIKYVTYNDFIGIKDTIDIASGNIDTKTKDSLDTYYPEAYSGAEGRKYYQFPFGYMNYDVYGDEIVASTKGRICIYDKNTKKMKFDIILPYTEVESNGNELGSFGIILKDYIDGRYLILSVEKWGKMHEDDVYNSIFVSYMYDLQTGEFTELARYPAEFSISPDRKYVAYTSPMGWDYGGDVVNNNLEAMHNGYYIRNIETGETVAFENEYFWEDIEGWVKEEKLTELINSDKYYVDESIEQRKEFNFLPKDDDTVEQKLDLSASRTKVTVGEKLVSVNEFTWGKYIPFVKYLPDNSEDGLYTRAFLSSKSSTTQEAEELYKKLDNAYKTVYSEGKSKYFYESRVIYVSENGEKVGVFSFLEGEGDEKDSLYELYKGEEKLFSDVRKNANTDNESGLYAEMNAQEGKYDFTVYTPAEYWDRFENGYSDNE